MKQCRKQQKTLTKAINNDVHVTRYQEPLHCRDISSNWHQASDKKCLASASQRAFSGQQKARRRRSTFEPR